MAKLWQGSGGGLHPLVEAYTVGEDYRLDGEVLLPYDLKASGAHATMLQKIGVLTTEELETLKKALKEIEDLWKKGDFKVTPSQEDGHTAIEQYITEKYGDVGKKIHTGRSRNDQSMTMIRLYSLEQLRQVRAMATDLATAAEARVPKLKEVAMPGYTHMQRAMPTTVGTWLDSFAQGWKDATNVLEGAPKGFLRSMETLQLHVQQVSGLNMLLEVQTDTSIREVKKKLKDWQKSDDELAKKMSTVELIVGGRKLTNDDSTVSSEGLTEESMVTVLYSIKVIECKEQTADSPESLLVVKIPEKEETIPMAAFEGCESLVKVMMPEVKEIRKNAFKDCGNLTILEIGDHTTRILANAFANCRSLITVDIKGKVISLQDFAFGFCSSMTEVTIPGSLLTIGADLFFGCTKLVTVKMPGCNLRHISAGCFRQCKALKKFIVPESVTSIDDLAFAGCIALEDIQIPESVTKIGRRVFKGCVALAEINLPKTVKHLGEGLFHGCTALEAFIVSDEVTHIDEFTFALCTSLTEITLPMINVLDQNPLGSAAGFGINGLALDREETAKVMGFAKVQSNPMYCGLSRGMFENVALQAMSFPMVLSSRFATDMMMFTQQETLFVALPDNFVTGSSIMPQKKNYDLFEIMRANGKVFGSLQMQIQETIIGLGSGYHRDLQCTKKAFIEACQLVTTTLELLKEAIPALQVREEKLKAAMTEDLYVTDEVYRLVAKGKAFREAYGEAKEAFFKRKAQQEASFPFG
eukprot:symbB.v1.2.005038.t2/scaffold291.1/size238869/3